MIWGEPTGYILGLLAMIAVGACLPLRLGDREDHVILTMTAGVTVSILGAHGLVLLWVGVLLATPIAMGWAVLPRNSARLGVSGAVTSVGWMFVSAFGLTVGFVLAASVYMGVFDGSFPIPLGSTSQVVVAGVVAGVAWVGTMSVRALTLRWLSPSLLEGGLDPFEGPLAPYVLPLIGGFPLITAAVAMYRPADPWPSLLILWWCFPIYAAAAFDLHRRQLAKDLRRDALSRQRLAAIGEVSARIVHQSRHQVGLMGWSIHRLRALLERAAPADIAAANEELDSLSAAKERLSEMLVAELLLERPGANSEESPETGPPASETLSAVVDAVVAELGGKANHSGIALNVELMPAAAAVPAPTQLRDVVFNLLDNALDAAASMVEVRAEWVDGSSRVRVCDDGPGLVGPVSERAFEPFFTTKGDGTGMGLAIADALVADLGGEVRYERSGDRTVFTVELPGQVG